MGDFYGCHFEFGNAASITYTSVTDHLVFANMDTSRYMKLYGDLSGAYIFTRADKKRILIDDDYSNFPVSIELEIVRDDGAPIPKERQRALEKLLFGTLTFRRVYISEDDDPDGDYYEDVDIQGAVKHKRLYMMARFINPERITVGCDVYGYKVTLETDSGLWWQEILAYHFYPEGASSIEFRLDLDTDISGFTYPAVTLTANSVGGDITWVNASDSSSRFTTFVNVPSNASIHLDGRTNYVDNAYYSRFQNMNFPRLKNGRNSISVTGAIAAAHVDVINRRRF